MAQCPTVGLIAGGQISKARAGRRGGVNGIRRYPRVGFSIVPRDADSGGARAPVFMVKYRDSNHFYRYLELPLYAESL
jgi:hypothetical protein